MLSNLPEKRYYSIGEVAKAFGVKPSLLRFWEKEFKQIQPKKKQSGTRKYTPEDLKQIQRIHYLLKEKGLTIEGAKKHLKLPESDANKDTILTQLYAIKDELERLKQQL